MIIQIIEYYNAFFQDYILFHKIMYRDKNIPLKN